MSRLYSATFQNIAVTAVQDLFELTCATNVAAIVHHIMVTTDQTADERIRIAIGRLTTSGSGGGTITPVGLDDSMPTADTTVERNNTTQGANGDILWEEQWSLIVPFQWLPPPEHRIVIPGAGRLGVFIESAPAASVNMSGTILFEELG